jgi:hypothetical protein
MIGEGISMPSMVQVAFGFGSPLALPLTSISVPVLTQLSNDYKFRALEHTLKFKDHTATIYCCILHTPVVQLGVRYPCFWSPRTSVYK